MRMPTIRSKQPCIHIMLVFSSTSTASVLLPFVCFSTLPSAACILNWIECSNESIVASQNTTAPLYPPPPHRIPLIRYLWHVVNGLNGTAAMSCHVIPFYWCHRLLHAIVLRYHAWWTCLFVCFSFEFLFLHKNAQNSLLYSHIDMHIWFMSRTVRLIRLN